MTRLPRILILVSALFLLCLLLIPAVAVGETVVPPVDVARYPTVALLAQQPQPTADRVDLAQRFLGVDQIPPRPADAPVWQIGDRALYYVSAAASGQIEQVEAELLAMGDHVTVWVEVGAGIPMEQAQAYARRFDSEIYEQTRSLWGSEDIPGIDGDARIYALFTTKVQRGIAAYFAGQNVLPAVIQPYSNEHEMLIFNLETLPPDLADDYVMSISAHEFQHMIQNHLDTDEESWIDEGLSMFTEYQLGLEDVSWAIQPFLNNPHNQLTSWGLEDNRTADYGAALLFMIYLHECCGMETLQQISAEPLNSTAGVDRVLLANNQSGMDVLFADWVLANVLQLPGHRYGYHSIGNLQPAGTSPVYRLPFSRSAALNQYATDYFTLGVMPESALLRVAITLPESIPLVPAVPASGSMMWYSGRGDDANPRLTRAFDLRNVSTAELRWRVWYRLEADWDYGYLSISTDGGRTWQIQPTALTTTRNPNGKAYGPGYSGRSGGWQEDVISLSAFAGQEILVRFEVVTDDATHEAGMLLDDLRVDAIGYFSDLETDDGGWSAEGWLHTDNRLPQRGWLQVAQQTGKDARVSRWLIEGSAVYDVALDPTAEQTVIAFSPFAPLTTEDADYTLALEAR